MKDVRAKMLLDIAEENRLEEKLLSFELPALF